MQMQSSRPGHLAYLPSDLIYHLQRLDAQAQFDFLDVACLTWLDCKSARGKNILKMCGGAYIEYMYAILEGGPPPYLT